MRNIWCLPKFSSQHAAGVEAMGKNDEDRNDWLASDSREDEEIKYLVENTDLSPNQVRELIRKHGTDRQKLLEIARTMKAEG